MNTSDVDDRTPTTQLPAGGADMLAIGLGTTAAMWAVGYVCRMPLVMAPPWVLAVGMPAVLLGGGYMAGRFTGRGAAGGFVAGIITALLNMMILGGVFGSEDAGGFNGWALAWVPGTLAATGLIMAVGAAIGARFHRRPLRPIHWNGVLTLITAAATALLLVAGGLVTSRDAGLSVPDWPNVYGYNMFLYPFARMTGNIYFEHAHRLYGALVGFFTIILTLHLWRNDPRKWLRAVMVVAVIAVITQGVMGGYRVALANTGSGIEVAAQENETTSSTVLRVAHGVFAQVFFALMVAVAVVTSRTWQSTKRAMPHEAAATEHGLTLTLVIALLLQLLLGALVRHLKMEALLHMGFAAVVFVLALAAGLRAWGIHGPAYPALRRTGVAIVAVASLQVLLGITAYALLGFDSAPGSHEAVSAVKLAIRTAHQANGAALLGLSTALMLFTRRLLAPAKTGDSPNVPIPLNS